jgi:type I phosphodiesterase/nucleotide pyrophosphatase
MSDGPPVPRYGVRSLAEVVPSLLSAAGVDGFDNVLGIEPMSAFCLLVIDGLGVTQLLEHRSAAPFMAAAAAAGEPVTAGFPSTTAASLGSLGTGLPPGEHGLVGYTMAIPGRERPMNTLLWELYGIGPHVDLRDDLIPEDFQPLPTLLERAEAAGSMVVRIGPPPHESSGFTRAILRGGLYRGAYWDHELISEIALWLRREDRASVYAYAPDLDPAGHSRGIGSLEWLAQLERFDHLAEELVRWLQLGEALFITGDHGMVNIDLPDRIDVGDRPELLDGVRFLGGEARARHVYAKRGAEADVFETWNESVGDSMWVRRRDEAIEDGWFGSKVADRIRPRIGEVVAASFAPVGVFQRSVDPFQWGLIGHHGSMTPAEQLVPLLEFRP